MYRCCIRCGRPITKCDGFVLARDLIKVMDGTLHSCKVREHCGICAGLLSEDDLKELHK